MNERNFIVIDTETSGLDPESGHEILQIAAKAYCGNSLNPHYADEFNIFVKPLHTELADPKAIKVIGSVWDKANNTGVHPKTALIKFFNWCLDINPQNKKYTRPILVGHNVGFDIKMLNHTIKENKVVKDLEKDCPWHYMYIDTLPLTFLFFESDPEVFSYSLDTLANKTKRKRTGSYHDALEDVRLTGDIFCDILRWIRKLMRNDKNEKLSNG